MLIFSKANIFFIVILFYTAVSLSVTISIINTDNRYQKKKSAENRNEVDGLTQQLYDIRDSSGITEINPSYVFGGGSCSVKDLKEIPRSNLTLVK